MPTKKRRRRGRIKPGISVEVIGDEPGHLRQVTEEFEKHLQEHLLNDAIQPTADFVEAMGKALAPRRTGHLVETITQRTRKSKHRTSIKVGPNYRRYRGYYYAPVQEFGSGKRNIQAVRFMRRAREAGSAILARLLAKATNRAIATYEPPGGLSDAA